MSEEKEAPVEAQATDEPNLPAATRDEDEEYVHLPAAINDEYGIPRSEARMMIQLGQIFVVDGDDETELVGTEKLDVPMSKVLGKTIRVKSDVRGVQFKYNGPQRDRFTGDRFA